MGDFLSVGSVIAFVIRVVSVIVLFLVLYKQWVIFGRANVYKSESKLKQLLFGLVIFTLLSNLPIMLINIERAYGHITSDNVTAVATIFNALSIFAIAIILYIIYSSKDGQDGY